MKRYFYLIIFILFLSLNDSAGQTNKDIREILQDLYDRIAGTKDDNEKLRLNDSLRLIIESYAESDSVFTHNFENLRFLGQITAPDRKLKIITWNVFMQNSPNRYYCHIIKRGEKKKANTIRVLTGMNREDPVRQDIVYTPENWYGALYYAIQPFRIDKKVHYIILGFDYGNLNVSRKIIDVLNFSAEGNVSFGLDCFVRDKETKLREVLEYSPEGIVSLRMENSKTIVFDQPAMIKTGHGDGQDISAAGISLNGYVLRRGIWKFVPDLDLKNKKKD